MHLETLGKTANAAVLAISDDLNIEGTHGEDEDDKKTNDGYDDDLNGEYGENGNEGDDNGDDNVNILLGRITLARTQHSTPAEYEPCLLSGSFFLWS